MAEPFSQVTDLISSGDIIENFPQQKYGFLCDQLPVVRWN
jgi:hypothetical protein